MNDLEQRLHRALADALPQHETDDRLLATAAGQARRIHRRRLATLGAIGVAAVATGGVVAATRSADAPAADRVVVVASATPSTRAAVTPGLVLTVVEDQCSVLTEGAPKEPCTSYVVEIHRAGGRVEKERLVWHSGHGNDAHIPTEDPVIGFLVDGVRRELVGRADGRWRWTFDVPVFAEGADVRVLSLQTEGDRPT